MNKKLGVSLRIRILLVCCFMFTACDKSVVSECVKVSDLRIKFTGKTFIKSGFPESGIFRLSNEGNQIENIILTRDGDESYIAQPIFLFQEGENWLPVPVSYSGVIIFSEVKPGEEIEFHTAIKLLRDHGASSYKLVVSDFESLPFSVEKTTPATVFVDFF